MPPPHHEHHPTLGASHDPAHGPGKGIGKPRTDGPSDRDRLETSILLQVLIVLLCACMLLILSRVCMLLLLSHASGGGMKHEEVERHLSWFSSVCTPRHLSGGAKGGRYQKVAAASETCADLEEPSRSSKIHAPTRVQWDDDDGGGDERRAMQGNRWSSAAIGGQQRQSVAISEEAEADRVADPVANRVAEENAVEKLVEKAAANALHDLADVVGSADDEASDERDETAEVEVDESKGCAPLLYHPTGAASPIHLPNAIHIPVLEAPFPLRAGPITASPMKVSPAATPFAASPEMAVAERFAKLKVLAKETSSTLAALAATATDGELADLLQSSAVRKLVTNRTLERTANARIGVEDDDDREDDQAAHGLDEGDTCSVATLERLRRSDRGRRWRTVQRNPTLITLDEVGRAELHRF